MHCMAMTLQMTHTMTGGYGQFQDMSGGELYKVANSGRPSKDHIATQTDGRFMVEIEHREISEWLHSDEQGGARRLQGRKKKWPTRLGLKWLL